jgi:hypothetical protein
MKELAKEYTYSSCPSDDGCLSAIRGNRRYKTKMKPSDLPEWYCDVHRCWWDRDMIKTNDVVDLKYTWVKENHFMKDSLLRISYCGKILEYNPMHEIGGKRVKSVFTEYTNVDSIVFGNDIFKCLAYIRKYSNFDLSKVKKEFVKQCNWLKVYENVLAPDTDDFGKWFDKTLESEMGEK